MRALTGSKPRISVNKKTGVYTITLPKTAISIPHPTKRIIAVDTGGSKTKVGELVDSFTIQVRTLPPYVYIEDVPKGESRRVSRQKNGNGGGGISALLTASDSPEEETETNHSHSENSPLVFERKGKRVTGGKDAGDLGGKTGLGTSKLELLEEKVIMSLLAMGGISPGEFEFKLSVALPYARGTFEAEEARVPRLLRRINWTQHGVSYNPKADLIKVVPEGAHGHLYSMLVDPSLPDYSKIKHMNIDGGWREIKALAFDSSNFGRPSATQSGIKQFGINEAYARVARVIGEENHEAPEFVNAVNEALKSEDPDFKYYVRNIGESVPLLEEARPIFDDFQEEYVDQVMDLIQPGYSNYCLFGGVMHHFGDAIAEEIEDRTGGECIIIDPFPEFANVICQVCDLACS